MAYQGKKITNPKAKMTITFLQTARDSNGRLLEMQATYAPNSLRPVAHYHPHQDEDFKIISGELTVAINGTTRILKAGDVLHIPRNTVHSMWNNSSATTIVHWQVRPAMNTENFLETVVGLASDGKTNKKGVLPTMQAALVANKYSNTFRLSKPPFIVQKIMFILLMPFAWLKGYRPDYKKYFD